MRKTAVFAMILVLFATMCAYAGKKQSTKIKIVPEGKITVDGSLKDWKAVGVKPIAMKSKKMVTHGAGEWTAEAGHATGDVYVAFSEEKLYVAAKVKAKKGMYNNNPGKDMWNGNAVEVFVGFDNSDPERTMYQESDYQIGFSPGKVTTSKKTGKKSRKVSTEIYCFSMEEGISSADQGTIKVKSTKSGYILEAVINGDFFDAWDVADGNEISFDISIDDVGPKGAARKFQLTWSSNKESWKDPSGWGKATLVE